MIHVRVTGLFACLVILGVVVACAGPPTTTVPPSREVQKHAQASGSPTGSSSPGVSPSPSSTPSSSPTPHVGVNPITDPWPKLDAGEVETVHTLIALANALPEGQARNDARGDALRKLVEILKRHCCNFNTMAGGAPTFAPDLDQMKGGQTDRARGGTVRIGPVVFETVHFDFGPVGGDVSWLYCTLKHEMVHSMQWQNEAAAKAMGAAGREKEAWGRQLSQAENCDLTEPEKTGTRNAFRALGGVVPPERDSESEERAELPLRLSIALPRSELRLGNGVPVIVRLRNVSDDAVKVNARLAVNDAALPAVFRELTFVIRDPSGAQAEYGFDSMILPANSVDFVDLRPRESVNATIDLAREYLLTQRGAYQARATYRNVTGPAFTGGPIRSNTVTFTLN